MYVQNGEYTQTSRFHLMFEMQLTHNPHPTSRLFYSMTIYAPLSLRRRDPAEYNAVVRGIFKFDSPLERGKQREVSRRIELFDEFTQVSS